MTTLLNALTVQRFNALLITVLSGLTARQKASIHPLIPSRRRMEYRGQYA
jgi:hypothetical protein